LHQHTVCASAVLHRIQNLCRNAWAVMWPSWPVRIYPVDPSWSKD